MAAASADELHEAVSDLPAEVKLKLQAALDGAALEGAWTPSAAPLVIEPEESTNTAVIFLHGAFMSGGATKDFASAMLKGRSDVRLVLPTAPMSGDGKTGPVWFGLPCFS